MCGSDRTELPPAPNTVHYKTDVPPNWHSEMIRQRLKQQVEDLRIEIDEVKRARQVAEVVETEYFQQLQEKARAYRASRQQRVAQPGESVATDREDNDHA